eukprot:633999-Rhodomonas_salina.1
MSIPFYYRMAAACSLKCGSTGDTCPGYPGVQISYPGWGLDGCLSQKSRGKGNREDGACVEERNREDEACLQERSSRDQG